MGAKRRANYYMQIAHQTDEEKLKMYMKIPKKELAKMLVNCNNLLSGMTQGAWQTLTVHFTEPKKRKP